MSVAGTDTYNGKISGNALVLGRTGSEKTSLDRWIGSNEMFRKLKKIHWIFKVDLSEERKVETDSCFKAEVKFYNPQEEYKLDETFLKISMTKSKSRENKVLIITKLIRQTRAIQNDKGNHSLMKV